ncbi:hypothetical protein [Arthrobacter sp. ZGTC412]|uniref:hypothetical protein n=1 Tax=Arthrobacter sp. ZGTC412 TaxID=2058900 RepID=UPI000CE5582E|nr:hypothetical protein [Arthrobacter sp. ZGTC412]
MAVPGDEDEQRQGFRLAFEAAPLTLEQIWIRYFGIGGKVGLTEVQAYVYGALSLPPIERDILAHALNESLNALGVNGRHATYSQAIHPRADEGERDLY